MGRRLTQNEIIEKFIKQHGNRFDYSKVIYTGNRNKVCIICDIHGEFWQLPKNHLNGNGCGKCRGMCELEFIRKCVRNHGYDKYDYSNVVYVNKRTKIEIICKEHGSFWQNAQAHSEGQCCPHCRSRFGESKISEVLDRREVEYIREKTFPDCKDKRQLPFDFYIPSKNLLIEYDGIQHFKPISFFGGDKRFEYIQRHDLIKSKYAENNGIILLRIPYTEFDDIERIISLL